MLEKLYEVFVRIAVALEAIAKQHTTTSSTTDKPLPPSPTDDDLGVESDEEDDLLGEDAKPKAPTLEELQDAIRSAAAINRDKAKQVVVKFAGEGKKAADIPEAKRADAIATLKKVKK